MTQKIAITQADSTVSIMTFVVNGRGSGLPPGAAWINDGSGRWLRNPSDANIEAEVRRAFPAAQSWRRISDDAIPQDRTFRDAMRDDGTTLHHDIEHARGIHRDRMRHERALQFVELDGRWMRAFATGNTEGAAAVEVQRQALRDAPDDPRIEAAQTVEELKALTLPG